MVQLSNGLSALPSANLVLINPENPLIIISAIVDGKQSISFMKSYSLTYRLNKEEKFSYTLFKLLHTYTTEYSERPAPSKVHSDTQSYFENLV